MAVFIAIYTAYLILLPYTSYPIPYTFYLLFSPIRRSRSGRTDAVYRATVHKLLQVEADGPLADLREACRKFFGGGLAKVFDLLQNDELP